MPDSAESRGVERYRALLRRPAVPALLGWAILARLPIGMTGLALILLVRSTGAGYGEAGVVTATYTVAVAVGQPYAGRQVDRRGAVPAMRLRLVAFPALLSLLALLGALDAPLVTLAVAAAAAGLTLPPVASVLRSIWPRVLGEDDARTAYALEAALQEAIFVGGPLIVAVLASFWAPAGVLGAAALAAVGTLGFVRQGAVRAAGPAEHYHGSPLGALTSAGVRTITLLALLLGMAFACVEIAVPAFAEAHGGRALAGIALAGVATGSLVGGLLAGLRPSSDEPRRVLLGTAAFAATLVLPLLSTSIAAMTALLFVAGLPLAPTIAATYGIIGRVATAGSVAEAFSWFGTALSAGFAMGAVFGGRLIDDHGWRSSIVLGIGFAVVGLVLAAARRRTLEDVPTGPVARV